MLPIVSQTTPAAAPVSAPPQPSACAISEAKRMRQADAAHFENVRKDVIAAAGEVFS